MGVEERRRVDVPRQLIHPRQLEHVRAVAGSVLLPIKKVDRVAVGRIQVVDAWCHRVEPRAVVHIAGRHHPAIAQPLSRGQLEAFIRSILVEILLDRVRVKRGAVEVVPGVTRLIAQAVAARRRERHRSRVVRR